MSEAMDRIANCVAQHYHFSNFHEYNAILRAYTMTAETGSPGSKTRRYNGLYYLALDDQGNRINSPVMASHLLSRPTLSRLQEKFQLAEGARVDYSRSIRQRIDWALDQRPPTLDALVARLQRDGIDIVRPLSNGRNPLDQIFVDHRTYTAVTGEALGAAYTTHAVVNSFGQGRRRGERKQMTGQEPQGARFSANVPQVLSAVFRTDPTSADDIIQDQYLEFRYKR
jgi:hypothetical protein